MSSNNVESIVDDILELEKKASARIRYSRENDDFENDENKIKDDVINDIIKMLETED